MAETGYINPKVAKMYGIPYSQLTPEQKRILYEDSVRRSKLIKEREEDVLRNNRKAFEDEAKMERVLGQIYKECQKEILADVAETIANVQKAGGDWSYANQSALTRSRGLFEQIDEQIKKLGQKESIVFTQGLGNIYTDQFLRELYGLGQVQAVKANFNKLNPTYIKATLDYPWSGAMFSDRLWNDKATLGRNLRIGLTQSMILGEGIPQITDRINKNINTSRYNAERVARTETRRVSYVAQSEIWEQNGVKELRYRCANGGDSRTCSYCSGDNNKVFKKGEEPTLPRHPNCRCTYIPVAKDTFDDNELNELTGSIRGSENYEKWREAEAKKQADAGKAQTIPSKNDKVKVVSNDDPTWESIKLTDYPQPFYATKAEAKNTQELIDFMNKQSNADKQVLSLYRGMEKLNTMEENEISFKISHGSSYSLSRRRDDWKLTIPKIDKNNPSTYITSLHEEMHLLDALSSLKKNPNSINGMYSRSNKTLTSTFSTQDKKMGEKVEKLFKEFNAECDKIKSIAQDEYKKAVDDLKQKYVNGSISWGEFSKLCKKSYKDINSNADINMRNSLGGGVSALQDIYDALSGGYHRDAGNVTYGHGGNYYSINSKRPSEALANYGSLSITHPELIEMLREDKPELCNALSECIEEMLKGVK